MTAAAAAATALVGREYEGHCIALMSATLRGDRLLMPTLPH